MSSSISKTLYQRPSFGFTTSAPFLPLSSSQSSSSGLLRRRLSSIHVPLSASSAASWALHRSKYLPAIETRTGSTIRKWWDSAWSWVLSRKSIFSNDLETNDEETRLVGSQSRGSWRRIFYKVRAEIRRLVGSDRVGLPQSYRYDSVDYSKNFDDGRTSFHL
ncbi:hypothetical protein SAY87_006228 [Trapa incisa]|uniref:Uncharacterized protein n=1 Tax=Trapa incisa TaxID=236973 RepID=A0AAN7KDW8_9MYRT|nr:hypothetical protein SAY87_006228 [Trapa incisa]